MGAPDDVAARLVAYTGIGSISSNPPTIYVGRIPETPDTATLVREVPGHSGLYTMGSGTGASALILYHAIQVITRAPKYQDAEALMAKVYAALDGWSGTLNSNVYLRFEARHPPLHVGEDESRRFQFSCNFLAMRRTR